MTLLDYLTEAVRRGASDLFLITGAQPSVKQEGQLITLLEERIVPSRGEEMIEEIYALAKRDITPFHNSGDDDFSFAVSGLARFRVNIFRQRGSVGAVIRVVAFTIPDWRELGIPQGVINLSRHTSGMILFTGTAGSGKSTTQACLIDRINRQRACHIITVEDPIEFLHRNQESIVTQREIAVDTENYLSALRACLRQAPDVIQLGEMRDLETIRTAMTAAETGHLLIGTLHTKGVVNAVDRIIDTFPPEQQNQIRIQLSSVLRTVVSQQLLPGMDGGLVPAFEIMHVNSAIRTMIRESKTHQLASAIASGGAEGMCSMDRSIMSLLQEKRITMQTALAYADNPEQLLRSIK